MADSEKEIRYRDVVEWLRDRLQRTIILSMRFIMPANTQNPLAYLGLLAFVCFLILGVTGVLLQVYYVPDFTGSYDSVSRINSEIPYGFELRAIHYYASDLMMLLAIIHFFYLYFKRKYQSPSEFLWIGGLVFGVVTILEAYTGYLLIMNQRAMLAVNIGSGLLHSIDPVLSVLLVGSSYSDLILRVYTLHLVAIPAIMVGLALIHFPKNLIIDISGISALVGLMLVLAGLAPPELGEKFIVGMPSKIIIPEWYLTGIYALLRTGTPVFVAGVLIPFVFLFAFFVIPFYDREAATGRNARYTYGALGLVALAHVCLVTIWGFRAGDFRALVSEADLVISPSLFYGSLLGIAVAIFAVAALLHRSRKSTSAAHMMNERANRRRRITVPPSAALAALTTIFVLQVLLCVWALSAQAQGLRELAMIDGGLVMFGFAIASYIYRLTRQGHLSQNPS